MSSKLKLGVLVSGGGSNLQAILDAIASGGLAAEVVLVVSNVASAGGLDRARGCGIPTAVVKHSEFKERALFDRELVRLLHAHGAEVVVLAGFMRIVTGELLSQFPMRVINVHPALLPSFPGKDAQDQAFDYGVRIAGCTVHFVDEGTDTGPIIAQAVVPVLDTDTKATLRSRILVQEHQLLPKVLTWLAEGRITIEPPEEGGVRGRPRVRVRGAATAFGLP